MQLSYFFRNHLVREMMLTYSHLPWVLSLIEILKIIYLQNISLFAFRQKAQVFTQRRELVSAFTQAIQPPVSGNVFESEPPSNIFDDSGNLDFGWGNVWASSPPEAMDPYESYVGASLPSPPCPAPSLSVPAPSASLVSKECQSVPTFPQAEEYDESLMQRSQSIKKQAPQRERVPLRKTSHPFLRGLAWMSWVVFLGIVFVMIITPQVHYEPMPTPEDMPLDIRDDTQSYYEAKNTSSTSSWILQDMGTGAITVEPIKISVCQNGNRYLSQSGVDSILAETCENWCQKGACIKLDGSLIETVFKQSFFKILSEELETGKYSMMIIIGFFSLVVLVLRELISWAIHKTFQACMLGLKWIIAHTWGLFFSWFSDVLFAFYWKHHTNQKILGFYSWLSGQFSLQETYREYFTQIYQEISAFEKLAQYTVESKQQILQEAKSKTQDLRDETQ